MKRSLLKTGAIGLSAVSLLCLGACADRAASSYEEQPTFAGQNLPGAQVGVVKVIDDVAPRQSTSGAGAVIGGVVGAIFGRQFGDSPNGAAVGTAVGAVGGALIGNEVEMEQSHTPGRFRVQVQMDDGSVRSFNFAQVNGLRVGMRVRVAGQGLRPE